MLPAIATRRDKETRTQLTALHFPQEVSQIIQDYAKLPCAIMVLAIESILAPRQQEASSDALPRLATLSLSDVAPESDTLDPVTLASLGAVIRQTRDIYDIGVVIITPKKQPQTVDELNNGLLTQHPIREYLIDSMVRVDIHDPSLLQVSSDKVSREQFYRNNKNNHAVVLCQLDQNTNHTLLMGRIYQTYIEGTVSQSTNQVVTFDRNDARIALPERVTYPRLTRDSVEHIVRAFQVSIFCESIALFIKHEIITTKMEGRKIVTIVEKRTILTAEELQLVRNFCQNIVKLIPGQQESIMGVSLVESETIVERALDVLESVRDRPEAFIADFLILFDLQLKAHKTERTQLFSLSLHERAFHIFKALLVHPNILSMKTKLLKALVVSMNHHSFSPELQMETFVLIQKDALLSSLDKIEILNVFMSLEFLTVACKKAVFDALCVEFQNAEIPSSVKIDILQIWQHNIDLIEESTLGLTEILIRIMNQADEDVSVRNKAIESLAILVQIFNDLSRLNFPIHPTTSHEHRKKLEANQQMVSSPAAKKRQQMRIKALVEIVTTPLFFELNKSIHSIIQSPS